MHLAQALSQGGQPGVDYLRKRLEGSRGDHTISDIVFVFELMARQGTYDVAADKVLMDVITQAIPRVKNSFWRQNSEAALGRIRAHKQ